MHSSNFANGAPRDSTFHFLQEGCHAMNSDRKSPISSSRWTSQTDRSNVSTYEDGEDTRRDPLSVRQPVHHTFSNLTGIHFKNNFLRCFGARITHLMSSSSKSIGMLTTPMHAREPARLLKEHKRGDPTSKSPPRDRSSPAPPYPVTACALQAMCVPDDTVGALPITTMTKAGHGEVAAAAQTKKQVCKSIDRQSARHRCKSLPILCHKHACALVDHYSESRSIYGYNYTGSPHRTSPRHASRSAAGRRANARMRSSFAGGGGGSSTTETAEATLEQQQFNSREKRASKAVSDSAQTGRAEPDNSLSRECANVSCSSDAHTMYMNEERTSSVDQRGEDAVMRTEQPSGTTVKLMPTLCALSVQSQSMKRYEAHTDACKQVMEQGYRDTTNDSRCKLLVSHDATRCCRVDTVAPCGSSAPQERGCGDAKSAQPARSCATHIDTHSPPVHDNDKDCSVPLEPESQRGQFVIRAHDDYLRRVPRGKVCLQPGHSIMHWSKRLAQCRLQKAKQTRHYTPEQVMRHNTADDMWIVISDVVYDVTQFQHYHPAGHSLLAQCAGRDATEVFNAFHSWVSCEAMLGPYAVGKLSRTMS